MMVWESDALEARQSLVAAEEAAKRRGQGLSAAANSEHLERARAVAAEIASERGSVTSDDVREVIGEKVWGAWAGAIFKRGFKPIGMTKCSHKGGHRRNVLVWAKDCHGAERAR